MRVLIVDDHALVLHGLALTIRDALQEADVVEATDAGKAVEAMQNCPADIALLDVKMPGVDGIELLKQIRARWSDTPVLMLTTYDDATYARAALAEGAAGYMLKDSMPADLLRAIRVAMQGRGSIVSGKVIQNMFDEIQPPLVRATDAELPSLTNREREILGFLVDGRTNKQIATDLYLSEKTVKAHLAAVYRKLGVANRTQAAMKALEMGLGG
jgi:DNA-binding NarL/FixJ family response regulator